MIEVQITDLRGKHSWANQLFPNQDEAQKWVEYHKFHQTWGVAEGRDFNVKLVDVSTVITEEKQQQEQRELNRKTAIQMLKHFDATKDLTALDIKNILQNVIRLLT